MYGTKYKFQFVVSHDAFGLSNFVKRILFLLYMTQFEDTVSENIKMIRPFYTLTIFHRVKVEFIVVSKSCNSFTF